MTRPAIPTPHTTGGSMSGSSPSAQRGVYFLRRRGGTQAVSDPAPGDFPRMRQQRHGLHPSPACTGSTAPAELTAVADVPARPDKPR